MLFDHGTIELMTINDFLTMNVGDPVEAIRQLRLQHFGSVDAKPEGSGHVRYYRDCDQFIVRLWQRGVPAAEIETIVGCSEGRVNKPIVEYLESTPEWKSLRR